MPYLFVCTQHMDVEITNELRQRLDEIMILGVFSNRDYGHEDVKAVLGTAGLMVGMRLHSIILSAAMLVPVVGLQYQPKVRFFLSSSGLEPYCLEFREFDAESLTRLIKRGWRERETIREQLKSRIPELQQSAKKAAVLAHRILND